MPQLYHLLKMISQGDFALARQELIPILQSDPSNTEAWSLMALAVSEPAQKADCYRQVLKLDPTNENARHQLTKLEAQLAAPAARTDTQVGPYETPAAPVFRPAGWTDTPQAKPAAGGRTDTQVGRTDTQVGPYETPAAPSTLAAAGTFGLIPPDPAPIPAPDWLASQPATPLPAPTPTKRRDFAAEAFEHISAGHPQQALHVIEEGLVANPKDPALWKLYTETGEAEYVKKQARRFLAVDPSNFVAQQALDRLKAPSQSKAPVRKDSCSEQIVYLIAGIGIIGILQVVMVITSAVTGANIFGDLADTPQNALGIAGVCINGVLALFSLSLWLYLGVAGWDSELNNVIKGAIVFVAILTPIGWYWVGRGAVRLTRVWLGGGESATEPAKASPPA